MKKAVLAALMWFGFVGFPLASPDETLMKVLIVFGSPGHSSVYLEHGDQKLYWDPGGFYGTELDECWKHSNEFDPNSACRRFFGFPWEFLKKSRRNDVFIGDAADLMRVISIYHLDGDIRSQVHTYRLKGERARKAWRLLAEGAELGDGAEFDTDRNPLFCVKGVTDYLTQLGGKFTDIPSHWYPEDLGKVLVQLGAKPGHIYTLDHPHVQRHIAKMRLQAGLGPLNLVLKEKGWEDPDTE